MNIRTPITALAIAIALGFTPALAAAPLFTTTASPAYIHSASHGSDTGRIVSIVHKVYFFKTLDRNHNGMLSRAELPADMTALRRNFVRADFDGNGQLSRREILLYQRGQAPQYIGTYHAYVFVYQSGRHNVELGMAQ